MVGTTDNEIISLFFERNENALIKTEEKFKRCIYKIAMNICGNHEDSEECINDTLLAVWHSIPPTRPENFTAYVCKTARNQALKRREFLSAQKRCRNAEISINELENTLFTGSTVNEGLEIEQLSQALNDFLKLQKHEVRYVFVRRYWFYDSIDDICKRCHISKSKAESMLFRTRIKLKDYLQKRGYTL